MNKTAIFTALALLTAAFTAVPAALAAEWGQPRIIDESDAGGIQYTRVASNASGATTILWTQSDGIRYNMWANGYVPGEGWLGARMIEGNDSGNAFDPQVVVAPDGTAHAVWIQYDGVADNLWYNRFVQGTGWGVSTPLANSSWGTWTNPRVGVDDAGDVVVTVRLTSWPTSLYSLWRTAGAGWSNVTSLENRSDPVNYADMAVGRNGDAFATWLQSDSITESVWAARFTPLGGWENATLIEFNNTYGAGAPDIAVDPDGNAAVVWIQSDGTRSSVFSNRYSSVSFAWGQPSKLESDDAQSAGGAQIAADGIGTFFALWSMNDGVRENLWTARNYLGGGWGNQQSLESVTDRLSSWTLAVGPDRNALALWLQYDGLRYNLWARFYDASYGWRPAALIEGNDISAPDTIAGAVDSAGGALAVWRQSDGTTTNLWANQFGPGLVSLPFAVTTPTNRTSTTDPTVVVAGTVAPGAAVVVNGFAAAVASDGSWSVPVPLHEGPNTIVATASDNRKNVVAVTLSVTFTDPRVFVEENLTATQHHLEDTQDALNFTEEKLDDTRLDLAIARGELTTTHADLNATKGELQSTRVSLTKSQADLASTNTLATVGLVLAGVGIALGAAGIVRAGRVRGAPPDQGPAATPLPPSHQVVVEPALTYEQQLERSRRPPYQ